MEPSRVIKLIREGALEECGEEDIGYVTGRRRVLVLQVLNPREYARKLTLKELKRICSNFRPPQSYLGISSKSELMKIVEYIDKCLLK